LQPLTSKDFVTDQIAHEYFKNFELRAFYPRQATVNPLSINGQP
jgi:hypothetical protein